MSESAFAVRRFSDDFARILRDRILSGELRPGERLNEVRLAEQYGISRSPIREALQALSGEGLVFFVAGKGAFVGSTTPRDIRDLGQVREALEVFAVELVAKQSTPEQLERIERSMHPADHASTDVAYAEVGDFHVEILRATGNERLEQHASAIAAQLRLARSQSATRPGRTEEAASEHVAIMAALRRRDPEAAGQAMRIHIRHATDNACAAIEAAAAAETSSD